VLRWFRPTSGPVSDEQIGALLAADSERGWTAFIESHTSTLLALIERAGVRDGDEAMEVYTRVCARLAADRCAALRTRDPAAGSLAGWLAVVVRRAAVDYVRSEIGRRRMFGAVRDLHRTHQRVFELYYWDRRPLAEVTEVLRVETREDVTLDRVLTDRHRAELLSLAARTRPPVPLDGGGGERPAIDPAADTPDPETALRVRETEARLHAVLATLPPDDAAIVTLKYGEGLTRSQIQRVLRLPELTEHRVRTIVATLRARLAPTPSAPAGVKDQLPRRTSV
jgi:RNA polymerase sigma factor (sigma-70 family)